MVGKRTGDGKDSESVVTVEGRVVAWAEGSSAVVGHPQGVRPMVDL